MKHVEDGGLCNCADVQEIRLGSARGTSHSRAQRSPQSDFFIRPFRDRAINKPTYCCDGSMVCTFTLPVSVRY